MDENNISSPPVDHIVQLMANFINYLNVSLYEHALTYNHEKARATLNDIYNTVSMTPSLPPSLDHCVSFYNNINCLTKVTYTDDPDYYTSKRKLGNYIVMIQYPKNNEKTDELSISSINYT